MTFEKVAMVGVPMDLGGGRRGVDMGPSAVRIAGVERHIRSLKYDFVDRGNISVDQPESSQPVDVKARFLAEISACCRLLCAEVQSVVAAGALPLVIGGDHSIACGTVAGISSHYHERGEAIGLLWFDAHGDMNTPESSESGNVHGMPLASCLGMGPDALTRIGARFPMVEPQNVALVGVRSLDDMERKLVKESGVACFTMRDIDVLGIHEVMGRALEIVNSGTCGFHCSYDLDGTDPSVAPGVGTPVPGGTTWRESHHVMETVADSGGLLGLEITELNPILDTGNKSAVAAVELILSALGNRIL
ncbi:MAG: arginase [Chlamydiales bacterium]|jgi:arginase